MSATSKNIDQILRTLTSLVLDERFVGRDNTGDFKIVGTDLRKALVTPLVKEISDDYTIDDDDFYQVYIVNTTAKEIDLTFPSLSTYTGPPFTVKNKSGANNVVCIPDGTDKINDYNANVDITADWGWWKFTPASAEWAADTDGNSTIYETLANATKTPSGFASGTWYDVTDIIISNLPVGKYILEARGNTYMTTASTAYINMYLGIGVTTGDVEPSIVYSRDIIQGAANAFLSRRVTFQILFNDYINTNATTDLYLKIMTSGDDAVSALAVTGASNIPIYLRARRVA